jgi:hypothetical protein
MARKYLTITKVSHIIDMSITYDAPVPPVQEFIYIGPFFRIV